MAELEIVDRENGVLPPPRDPESAFGTKEPARLAPRSITRDLDPPGAEALGLSPEEIVQFREQGYVIKRGLIDPALFQPFLDLWWQQPPVRAAALDPDDRSTWRAPGRFWPAENRWGTPDNWMGRSPWPSVDVERAGAELGERVGRLPHKLTKDVSNDVWRWHGIGHDPAFVDATSAHPNVLYMAELLLGGPIKRPRRNRGIYSIFPRDLDGPASALGPHMDQSMTEMQVVTYLSEIGPQEGGFTIYPTSPQRLYHHSTQAYNWVAGEGAEEAMNAIKREVEPIEFCGRPGDVIFCHGWVVHSAGVHEGERVRLACIQDFNRSRERGHMRWTAAGKNGGGRVHATMDGFFRIPTDTDDDPADGLREVTNQWIMDSNEFVTSRRAPFNDMFAEWNLGAREPRGNVVDEVPWWERYGLPMLPSLNAPRGGGGVPAVSLDSVADYEGDGVWRIRIPR